MFTSRYDNILLLIFVLKVLQNSPRCICNFKFFPGFDILTEPRSQVEIIKGFFRIIRNVTCQQLGIGVIGGERMEMGGGGEKREGRGICLCLGSLFYVVVPSASREE